MVKKRFNVSDISRNAQDQMVDLNKSEPMPLPEGVAKNDIVIKPLTESQQNRFECALDGVSCIALPKPKSKEEEDKLVQTFLSGLKKLLSKDNNWTFLQPLTLSLEYCAKCLACSEECPVYLESGRQEIYRPNYRSEILRRIKKKYLDKSGKTYGRFTEGDIELNWATIARLAELSYRCTICRRCTQGCTRGVDNGLITHELRKLFSQEMGIAPVELHKSGSLQQLTTGGSTGITPKAFGSIIQFMEEEIGEKTGKKIKVPVDKKGADILLIHNSGEYLSWLENPEAFAILFEAAGLDWTLSSEAYEATNYGLWYDDVQFARIALKQMAIARKLGVKRIVIGECGHAHKALMVVADRLLTPDNYVPRESCLPLLAEIVNSGKLNLDPTKNNFPVTLHDPCNITRLMGIVAPQRQILRRICPQFREMSPRGVSNYCCGGGSGFAVINNMNFPEWRNAISGRMKLKQVIETFKDVTDVASNKYVCAPCSNCKGQLREVFNYHGMWPKFNILYGGIVELIVNAMPDLPEPFIKWEWR